MTTLRVILDEMLAPGAPELSQYASQLTAALIQTAPTGCAVDGFVSASPEDEYERILGALPGLGTLHKSSLARRELTAAWQHGFTRIPGRGMLHAPSLLAPLARHDRLNDQDQVVVTLYDTLAWTDPASLPAREVAKRVALAKRAERYADAVVVPSHAVAERADELLGFGDRIRVIPAGAGIASALPENADARAAQLNLPDRYVLAIDSPETHAGIQDLLEHSSALPVPLIVIADESADPADLAVAIARAAVLIHPAVEVGFGMTVLDAMVLGTPVVHSDAPALVELTAEAASVVERDGDHYGARLANAANEILVDDTLALHRRYAGEDRARTFSWHSAADKIWQLHADL